MDVTPRALRSPEPMGGVHVCYPAPASLYMLGLNSLACIGVLHKSALKGRLAPRDSRAKFSAGSRRTTGAQNLIRNTVSDPGRTSRGKTRSTFQAGMHYFITRGISPGTAARNGSNRGRGTTSPGTINRVEPEIRTRSYLSTAAFAGLGSCLVMRGLSV